MRSGPDGGRREFDVYERAGACVPFSTEDQQYRFAPPLEHEEVLERVLETFSPRRSSGDFIDFSLNSTEYFVFSLLAGELVERGSIPPGPPPLDDDSTGETELITPEFPEDPTEKEGLSVHDAKSRLQEGTPMHDLLRTLPGTSTRSASFVETEWNEAVEGLVKKDLVVATDGRFRLRAYLEDLAVGLATRRRLVLTRFDFAEDDWVVRDVTLIEVPGSIFLVQTTDRSVIRIVELDGDALGRIVRKTMAPHGNGSESDDHRINR
jgi:hypothetical protein